MWLGVTAGVNPYVQAPSERDELVAKIERILQTQRVAAIAIVGTFPPGITGQCFVPPWSCRADLGPPPHCCLRKPSTYISLRFAEDFYANVALLAGRLTLLDGYRGVAKVLQTRRVDTLKINRAEFLQIVASTAGVASIQVRV